MHKAGILVAALLLLPAVSQAKTLDELLVERGVVAKDGYAAGGMSAGRVYYDNGTRVEFPDNGFTFGINTQFITRYDYTDVDGAADEISEFSVESARVVVSGSALNKEFEYMVSGDFVDSPSIKDAWLKWNACDWVWAKMGRYKTGVSRQWNNHDTKLQFADRSIASERYNFGRSEGLSVGGGMEGFSWGLAAFNDASDAENTDHLWIANARYSMGDINAYAEGDVDNSADHGFTVGAAYAMSDSDSVTFDTFAAGEDVTVLNLDAMWKFQGWSLAGEWYTAEEDGGDDRDEDGWYAQAGYFIIPSELEVAGRYSMVSYDDSDARDQTTGWDLGLNYYWWKHQLKAQLNYSQSTDEARGGAETDTDRFILQLVSWF